MNHFMNNAKEFVKRKKRLRQFRSRQGKSDARYSRDMKLAFISYVGLIVILMYLILKDL